MRAIILAVLAATVPCGADAAATSTATVQYRTAAEVAAARATGNTGGPVMNDSDFRVMAVRRDKVGESEVHTNETDIFFVVDGKAIIVVGGEIVGGRETAPGELRGIGVKGGTDYPLEPGIVLTIPRGTPHWIRETTPGFRYFVVKTKAKL